MSTQYKRRALVAVLIMVVAVLAVVIPVVWFINNRDWGVLLIMPAPFLVYALIRLAQMLERWVRGHEDTGGHF